MMCFSSLVFLKLLAYRPHSRGGRLPLGGPLLEHLSSAKLQR